MKRTKDGFDDLDAMRQDMDELGQALHAEPKGAAPRGPEGPGRKAKDGAPKAKPIRGRKRLAAGLLALSLAVPVRAGDARETRRQAAADSLRALRVVISVEIKPGNAVMALKNPRAADSLLRGLSSRESVLEALRDSSLARTIRDPDEFRSYWNRLEERNGIKAVKGRMAAQDVDRSRIPKAYLFDSSVVVYPGWIIVRRARL